MILKYSSNKEIIEKARYLLQCH